jgi:integrase
MRLTRKAIAALTLPKHKPYLIVWDDELPGFGVRLNPTGKVWVVQYRANGKSRRETIGRVDAIAPEMARDNARKTLARVRLGADPHAEKAEAAARRAVTFVKVSARYLQNAQGRLKPRSFEEVNRHLTKHWAPFKELPLRSIDRPLIAAKLDDIAKQSGPIAANRARAALSALYSYALGMGLADQNPVVGTLKLGDEIKRDHVLSDHEIAAVWKASGDYDYGRIIRILTLTGQRRDEVGSMRWSEIDLEKAIWTLPTERTKNHRVHEVPLSKLALSILRNTPRLVGRDIVFGSGKGGFSGWSKAKRELDLELQPLRPPIKPWRIHDLRRTAATGMANIGVSPHVVEAVLNHVSGTRAGVAGIYNRAAYREEKRDALIRWSDHVEKIAS